MSIQKLISALRDNVGGKTVVTILPATVVSTEETSCTVKLLSNEMELDQVQYTATQSNENGFKLIPKIDTQCIIALVGDGMNTIYLLAIDEIEKVELKCEDSLLEIDSTGITINGGENGGILIGSNVTDEINDIKSDINNLKTILSAWVPVVNDGGAALKGALAAYFGSPLTPAVTVDLENDQITH